MALRIGLLIAVLVAALAWFFWPAPTEEDRVREVIHAVADGAEAGDVGDVLVHVSDHFQGDEALTKADLKALLQGQFLRRGPITVVIADIPVRVEGGKAHASFDALLAEGSGNWKDVLPVNLDGWHFEVDLALEDGEAWRVVAAERSDLDAPR